MPRKRKKRPEEWVLPLLRESSVVWDNFRVLPEHHSLPETQGMIWVRRDGEQVISKLDQRLPEGYCLPLSIHVTRSKHPFRYVFVRGRSRNVSRLVLFAWIGPPPDDSYRARHISGNMLDDSLDNVMWDLRTNICSGTIARGTWHHGERHQAARFSDDQVRAIRKLLSLQGVTQNLIARALDCSQTTVLNLSKGQHQLDNQAHTKRIAEDKDRVAQTLAYRQQS